MHVSNTIRFPHAPHAEFFQTLRTRIQAHFAETNVSKHGNLYLYSKGIILFSVYFGLYALILSQSIPDWAMLLSCLVMGVAACGLGTNVMHDALHNSYTDNRRINRFFGCTMELLGGSSLTWHIQHNVLHHTYTNVYGMDEDIHDKPMLRLSPDGQLRWYHRFQHFYAVVLYSLSTVSWVFQKDFKQFGQYWRDGQLQKLGLKPLPELAKLVAAKVAYLTVMLVIPMWVLDVSWYWVVLGFLMIQVTTGLLLTLIFLTAHAVEDAHHFQPDDNGNLENNWAIHQVQTTCNFRARTWFWRWLVGGLDHQIEHHLFPNISHVHYPALSPIVRQTAEEYGLPYFVYPSFSNAIASHFRYLREIGNAPMPQAVVA
jgi:linoleoyl-CoA desaturase